MFVILTVAGGVAVGVLSYCYCKEVSTISWIDTLYRNILVISNIFISKILIFMFMLSHETYIVQKI